MRRGARRGGFGGLTGGFGGVLRRKKRFSLWALATLLISACAVKEIAPELQKGDIVTAKVVSVYDGDTLTALVKNSRVKVRLYGIDAPEAKQKGGEASARFARKVCLDKTATIEIKSTDKYGRKVGVVTCGSDETSLNRQLVANGHAWAYTQYSKIYKLDELNARRKKVGLWREKNPQNPADFRRSHSNQH